MKETTYLGYVHLNNETIYEVGKFAILWNIFEDVKCDCNCSLEIILNIAQEIYFNKYGYYEKEVFEELAFTFKNRAKKQNMSIENYVHKSLYPSDSRARISRNERETFMAKVIDFITSDGKEALDGALLAIWRIRNNMFHGLKGHSLLDGQIDLFISINNVLEVVNKW